MSWLAIKLFMGGALRRIGGMFASLFEWSKRNPALALLIAVSLIGGFYTWRLSNKLEHTKQRLAATEKAFAGTIVNYRLAAIKFQKAQADNLVRVAKEQKENADEQIAAFKSDTDDWRGRFERLRASRNQSRASDNHMSTATETTSGTPQPNPDPGQPTDSEMIAVRIDDLETLVKGIIQGEAIRKLFIANEGVDTSPH